MGKSILVIQKVSLKVHRVKSSWIELGVVFKTYVCHKEIRNVGATKDFWKSSVNRNSLFLKWELWVYWNYKNRL